MKEYTFKKWQTLAEQKKVLEYEHLIAIDIQDVEPVRLTKINILCPCCKTFVYDVNFLPREQYQAAIHLFHSYDQHVYCFCRLCGWRGHRLLGEMKESEKKKRFERRFNG